MNDLANCGAVRPDHIPPETEIPMCDLYAEWRRAFAAPDSDESHDEMLALEDRINARPATSAYDFAVKFMLHMAFDSMAVDVMAAMKPDAERFILDGDADAAILSLYASWLPVRAALCGGGTFDDAHGDAMGEALTQIENRAARLPASGARALAAKIHMACNIQNNTTACALSVVADLKTLTNGAYSHD